MTANSFQALVETVAGHVAPGSVVTRERIAFATFAVAGMVRYSDVKPTQEALVAALEKGLGLRLDGVRAEQAVADVCAFVCDSGQPVGLIEDGARVGQQQVPVEVPFDAPPSGSAIGLVSADAPADGHEQRLAATFAAEDPEADGV